MVARGRKRRKRSKAIYRVFLSHSNRDTWLAGIIKEKIEAAASNVEVWLDEMSLAGGQEVIAALAKGIRDANEIVVLVSNESLRSQWVAWEIGMATAWKKRLLPLLNNVDHDAMAPLKGVKAYELNQFPRVLLELKRRAGKPEGKKYGS